jgi:glycerol-3-phosphate acyltransferase PlsY
MTSMAWLTLIGTLALGYLLGSLPWGLWIGKLARGLDVRQHGSGNLGATNVYRVLGPRWGILTLLLDVTKGAVAVWLAPALGLAGSFPGGREWCAIAAGAAAIAGHVWTFLASFRGGKGVATLAGVMLALAPLAFAGFVAVFVVTLVLTRYVSLGSVLGALALPVILALTTADGVRSPRFLLGVVLAVVVVVRHHENLRRLVRGEERRFAPRGGAGRTA